MIYTVAKHRHPKLCPRAALLLNVEEYINSKDPSFHKVLIGISNIV